jgi:hypothetical protein
LILIKVLWPRSADARNCIPSLGNRFAVNGSETI